MIDDELTRFFHGLQLIEEEGKVLLSDLKMSGGNSTVDLPIAMVRSGIGCELCPDHSYETNNCNKEGMYCIRLGQFQDLIKAYFTIKRIIEEGFSNE